jgi:putative transposase
MQLGDAQPFRLLIHDRDKKFSHAFDEVFRSEAIEVIRTPIQAPNANAYAERWVRTVRADCLDRILILGRRHLEHVLHVYRRHTTNTDRIARSTSCHPMAATRSPSVRRPRPSTCAAAISPADSSTNTKPRPDRVCEPYGKQPAA